jgi:hypothetical protein
MATAMQFGFAAAAYNGDGLRDSLTTGGNMTTFTWDVNRYVYGVGCIALVDDVFGLAGIDH